MKLWKDEILFCFHICVSYIYSYMKFADIAHNTSFCFFTFSFQQEKYPTIIGYKNMTSKLKHFFSSSQGKNGFGWHYDDGLEQHTSEWSKEKSYFFVYELKWKKVYSYHVVFHVIVNNPYLQFLMETFVHCLNLIQLL